MATVTADPAVPSLVAGGGPAPSGDLPRPSAGTAGTRTAAASGDPGAAPASNTVSPAAGQGAGTPQPSTAASPVPTPGPAPGVLGEIRLGSVGVASGPIGAAVSPIAEGARAWVADVNARGGIAGRKVRLFQADDGGDPARSVAIVKRLVEQEKVQAFYSNFMVTTEEAVVRYLEEQQVPAIGGCSCSSAVDASPMLFPIGPGAPLGETWAHVLPFLTQTDKRKASILYCREAANCSVMQGLMEGIAAEAGFSVVHQAQVSIAQPDYTAEVLAASNAGADVIVGLMDNASLVRVAKSAHRQGYNPVFSIQQSGFDDALLSQADEVEGFVTAGIVPDHNNSPKLADYRAALARYVPGGAVVGKYQSLTLPLPDAARDLPDFQLGGMTVSTKEPLRACGFQAVYDTARVDVMYEAFVDPFAFSLDAAASTVGKDHYESMGRVDGTVTVGERELAVSGFAWQDHSWGRRHWPDILSHRWICANFGPDLFISAMTVVTAAGRFPMGFVHDAGTFQGLARIDVGARVADDGHSPRACDARIWTTTGHGYHLTATVDVASPSSHEGGFWFTDGLATYELGGRLGAGILEVHELSGPAPWHLGPLGLRTDG